MFLNLKKIPKPKPLNNTPTTVLDHSGTPPTLRKIKYELYNQGLMQKVSLKIDSMSGRNYSILSKFILKFKPFLVFPVI